MSFIIPAQVFVNASQKIKYRSIFYIMITLVIGKYSFIGSNIVKYVQDRDLVGVSSAECDLLSYDSTISFFSQFSNTVINVVFCSGIGRHLEDSLQSHRKNVCMMETFLLALQTKNIELNTCVFLSSIDVYGDFPNLPICENTKIFPSRFYGASKASSEMLLNIYFTNTETKLAILRLPGIYGATDNNVSIISKFYNKIRNNETINIFGSDAIKRDYVYIEDLCFYVKSILDMPQNIVLNISSGKSVSLIYIIKCLENLMIKNADINYYSSTNRSYDIEFNTSLLKKVFPRFQATSIENGIERYVTQKNLVITKKC